MEEIIGVRELLKNFTKVTERAGQGQDFLVIRNSKPILKITGVRNSIKKKKKYTLKDIEKLTFSSGEEDLSKQIDKIVYGL